MMIIAYILGGRIDEKSSTELGLPKSKRVTRGVKAEITRTPSHAMPGDTKLGSPNQALPKRS